MGQGMVLPARAGNLLNCPEGILAAIDLKGRKASAQLPYGSGKTWPFMLSLDWSMFIKNPQTGNKSRKKRLHSGFDITPLEALSQDIQQQYTKFVKRPGLPLVRIRRKKW